MATKKKVTKMRDLKPSKDAKGGAARQNQSAGRNLDTGRSNLSSGRSNTSQSSSRNLL